MMKNYMLSLLMIMFSLGMFLQQGFAAYLFDTGTPDTSLFVGSYDLNTKRPLIAAQITNTEEWHISSIEGYIMTYPTASNLQVKIWQDNNTNIPGNEYLTSDIISLEGNGLPSWQGIHDLDWTLPAGTWWVGFIHNSGWAAEIVSGSMGGPDNSPREVQYAFINNEWKWHISPNYNYSLRIGKTSAAPMPVGIWLLSSCLLVLVGLKKFRKS